MQSSLGYWSVSSANGSAHGVTGGGVLGGGGCLTMLLMCPSPSPGLPPSPKCFAASNHLSSVSASFLGATT